MIDTHAHLDALEGDLDQILASARAAGVTRVVTIGTGIASSRRAVDIAESHDGVFAALGIDPHQAATPEAARVGELRDLLGHARVVAVGETGLDGHHGADTLPQQHALFDESLAAVEIERQLIGQVEQAALRHVDADPRQHQHAEHRQHNHRQIDARTRRQVAKLLPVHRQPGLAAEMLAGRVAEVLGERTAAIPQDQQREDERD